LDISMNENLDKANAKTRDLLNSLIVVEGETFQYINEMNTANEELADLFGVPGSYSPFNNTSPQLPQANYHTLTNQQIIELLQIPYEHNDFSQADKKWIWLAIVCGSITDVLVTQLDILKPLDTYLK